MGWRAVTAMGFGPSFRHVETIPDCTLTCGRNGSHAPSHLRKPIILMHPCTSKVCTCAKYIFCLSILPALP